MFEKIIRTNTELSEVSWKKYIFVKKLISKFRQKMTDEFFRVRNFENTQPKIQNN